jgi:ribosome assembly protein SQT1
MTPFHPPAWAPSITDADIPDDISIFEFLFDDKFRPRKCDDSPKPFVDSVSGQGYDIPETKSRVESLAAGLASQLEIGAASGNVWQRVVCVFAVNNVRKRKRNNP